MRERVRVEREHAPAVARQEQPRLRRRLTVGPADDAYEREADAVAATVMANLARPPVTLDGTELQRRPSDEGADGVVGVQGGPVPAGTASRIRPSGDRFDDVTRSRMEGAFGADFSGVRVHTSATIDTAAEGLQADAFTVGREVYVRRSLYRPGTAAGDSLLAHELTHTLQQGAARVRRSASAVAVRSGMPADRVSTKKRMLYLDFVKMRRYDPKYGKAIKETLGMDVDDDSEGGTFGHWWTEVGVRDPDTGTFTHKESYGWWPVQGVGGVGDLLGGVPGALNKGYDQDPHAGDPPAAGLTEFHPAMNVDTDAEDYDAIRKRVTADIDTFANGYKGKWHWKLGWGKNCHTFQQSMKTQTKMHYQKASGWLVDPSIKAQKAVAAKATSDNLALVASKPWFVYTQSTIGTILPDGEDGPNLKLDASKEFAATGKRQKFGAYWVHEVVTRLGERGWVSEMELRSFSNM